MKFRTPLIGLLAASACLPVWAQPTVKTTTDEVLLDLIVRDKKGKPVTDLRPEDVTVSDDGVKQTLTSFRLVRGTDAIGQGGAVTTLDPLRQVRLVTIALEPMEDIEQRRLARSAATDLVKGEQGTNVFYSVVEINTRLMLLQPFTKDKAALIKAIDRATGGLGGPQLASESDALVSELKRNLGPQSGADAQDTSVRANAVQTAAGPVSNGDQAVRAKLASVMLDMLRMDAAAQSQGTRLTLAALKSLVMGLQAMPGRKSVVYFSTGLYVTPELDVPLRNLASLANRANVTFYSVDTRGVMTMSQNSKAMDELRGAASASATTVNRTEGGVTKDEIKASDNAEVSGRSNVQLPIRDLAESTGGFLIGDSNDLRVPLRQVNEEIASYYELSFNPGITNYDGSFHKLSVSAARKDLVIHSRNGYFALPPEARAAGLQTFELPLLKVLSDGKLSTDVNYQAGTALFQAKKDATDAVLLVEVPLRELQSKPEPGKNLLQVHCSLIALVKDAKGAVVQTLSRDRPFQVTPDQSKMGIFTEKSSVALPPGKYTLESAVMDRETGKIGAQRTEFTVAPAPAKGVEISSLTQMRSYTPNAKGLDPNEPFQFQGGSISPTLENTVKKAPNSALRLFFTVYQDKSIAAKPSVEVEFLQGGKSLTKVPMELPAADAQGRIPYLMTIPAASIPPGTYEIRAIAKQGDSSAATTTTIKIEAM